MARTKQPAKAAQSAQFAGPCPRCGGGVPNSIQPGAYPGALSRVDNETYICSACGVAEAMFNFNAPGRPLPPVTVPITFGAV